MVGTAENEEGIGRILSRFPLITLKAAPERALAQLIRRPGRFPRCEKCPALVAQPRPSHKIADARVAQIDSIAADHRLLAPGEHQAPHKSHTTDAHSAACAGGLKRRAKLS